MREKFNIKHIMFLMLFSLFISFVNASMVKVKAPSNIYKGCVQPYVVQLDSNGISTKSMDTRLFLSGYFSLSSPYNTISEALSDGNIYANYIPGGEFQITTLNTGVASSGDYQGSEYLYLNSYQIASQIISPVSGNDLSIATLYLKANNFTTGYIDFYYVTGWNGDDTNVSSGIHEANIGGTYTLYEDSLTGVTNLEQLINAGDTCNSRPYINNAVYRQTGYVSVPGSTAVQAVWTSVNAGLDYSNPSDWTIWTNGDVILTLTGVSDDYSDDGGLVDNNLSTGIQINDVSLLNNINISPINFVIGQTGWSTQYYEMLITGNFEGVFEGFDNILGNTGSTYNTGGNKYSDDFNVDVFWIDTIAPNADSDFTGFVLNTGVGYTTFRLSGVNYDDSISNSTNGYHASWTHMDDQYKVISFSGTNSITQDCQSKYPCTTVGYMEYMNNTGYVVSGNNDFQLLHDIVFTTSFSGYINIIDRAGNTGQILVEVNMDDLLEVEYGLIAYSESKGSRVTNSLSGMLLKLAIYSGGFDKQYLIGNPGAGIELVYTGRIKTSSTGYASFTGNFNNSDYWVLAEGVNTLAYLISGVSLTSVGGIIDFSQDYPMGFKFGDLSNVLTQGGIKHANYDASSIREQEINVSDLAILIAIWAPWNQMNYESGSPEIGVYTGSLFVDIPNPNKILSYNDLLIAPVPEDYMQYHPYDLDANGQVNLNDYGILFDNLFLTGATFGGHINGVSSSNVTMPF